MRERGGVEGGIWVAKLIYMLTIRWATRKLLLLLPTLVDGESLGSDFCLTSAGAVQSARPGPKQAAIKRAAAAAAAILASTNVGNHGRNESQRVKIPTRHAEVNALTGRPAQKGTL